jgi:transposase
MYTKEQLEVLRANKNVAKCSSKSITYSREFKVRAVKAYYQEGQSPNAIFLTAGFDLNVIGRKKPKDCLKDWRNTYKSKGEDGLLTENRGRSRWKKPRGDDTDVEYLQTKIAYLEAENNFLRNLKTKTKD